jgi:hypothetical protein
VRRVTKIEGLRHVAALLLAGVLGAVRLSAVTIPLSG